MLGNNRKYSSGSAVSSLVGSYTQTTVDRLRYYGMIFKWKINAYRNQGSAPLEPTRLYSVPVDNITYQVSPEPFDRTDAGRVVGGEWDLNRRHLVRDDCLYQGLVNRYEHGKPWANTDFYNKQTERIKRGETAWGCSTLSELSERYQHLDKVCESIQREGYRSAHVLADNRTPQALDDIGVHIARDGELLFAGEGNHRIRLAKLLNVDTIVVRVLVRHNQWQSYRNDIAADRAQPTDHKINTDHFDIRSLV